MYYFVDLIDGEDGRRPDLPDEVDFLELAGTGRSGYPWAVYRCWFDDEPPSRPSVAEVPDELSNLLASAERYPPALALARDDMARSFRSESPTQEQFARALCDSLRHHLANQPSSPYFLAVAAHGQPGHLTEGEYYWIVAYDSVSKTVYWVSDDYFVYPDDTVRFVLSDDDLRLLGPLRDQR